MANPSFLDNQTNALGPVGLAGFVSVKACDLPGADIGARINRALTEYTRLGNGLEIIINGGNWELTTPIEIRNKKNIRLIGQGPCTKLIPTSAWPNGASLFSVSGSSNCEIANFQVDGANLIKPTLQLGLIFGEGTTDNPAYGGIHVHHLVIKNWQQQGFGIGANAAGVDGSPVDSTVEDIWYTDNSFYNCFTSVANNFTANAIDTGASGTKRRFIICRNIIRFGAWAADPSVGGHGVFAGHGKNYDFIISDNHIFDPPTHGISVYNRNYATESVELRNFAVSGNTVNGSGWSGIAVFGGTQVSITGNTIRNPGKSVDPLVAPYGVLVAHAINGNNSKYSARDILISGNVMVDDQATSTMIHGIMLTGDSGYPSHGVVGINCIRGSLSKSVNYNVDTTPTEFPSIVLGSTGRFGFNLTVQDPIGAIDAVGDVIARLQNRPNGVFTALLADSAYEAAGFWNGVGINIRFNPTTERWETADGLVNNGGAVIASDIGDPSVRFLVLPSTGNGVDPIAPQVFTQAQFLAAARKVMTVHRSGGLGIGVDPPSAAIHLKAGSTASGSAPLKINPGVLMATPENNSLEYDGTDWWYTTQSGVRKKALLTSAGAEFISDGNILSRFAPFIVGLISRSLGSAGGYRGGVAVNGDFDGTNWIFKSDGTSNGGALVLGGYGPGALELYVIPSLTGGAGASDQVVAPVSLYTYKVLEFDKNGHMGRLAPIDASYFNVIGGSTWFTSTIKTNLTADKFVKTDGASVLGTGSIAISDVTGLQTALDAINASLADKASQASVDAKASHGTYGVDGGGGGSVTI